MRVISARTTGTQIPAAEEPPRRATAPIRCGNFFKPGRQAAAGPSLPPATDQILTVVSGAECGQGGKRAAADGALICPPPRVQADHAWCGAGVGGFTEATHALDTGESVGGSSEASPQLATAGVWLVGVCTLQRLCVDLARARRAMQRCPRKGSR